MLNFDYLRLFLAITVMFRHIEIGVLHGRFWNSEYAVLAFFCISGYLVTQSYLRCTSLEEYAKKRFFRVYPPILFVTVALCVFGFISHQEAPFYRGVLALPLFQDWLVLAEPGLKQGVYGHGAFWTLVIELQFYLLLPATIWALKNKKRYAIIGLIVAYFAAHYLRRYTPSTISTLAYRDSIFNLLHYFIAGVTTAYYAPKIYEHRWFYPVLVPGAMLVYWVLAAHGHPIITHFLPFAMMILILACANLCGRLGRTAIWGDASYGVYLYHFPVITVLTYAGLMTPMNVAIATLITALLSWHFMESKLIGRS